MKSNKNKNFNAFHLKTLWTVKTANKSATMQGDRVQTTIYWHYLYALETLMHNIYIYIHRHRMYVCACIRTEYVELKRRMGSRFCRTKLCLLAVKCWVQQACKDNGKEWMKFREFALNSFLLPLIVYSVVCVCEWFWVNTK